MELMMEFDFGKTAAIVITGNEILSGKVPEQNAQYLARELRALGVNLERVTIIPDQTKPIAEEIAFCKDRFDFIFTSGGIGPTHDDVTVAGVALGLSRKLIENPALSKMLRDSYPDRVNPALMKMAYVPEGTEFIFGAGLKSPVLLIENIYIFPGVPEFLVKKFSAIKERFQEAPFYLKKIFLRQDEEKIAEPLNKTLEQFPRLLLGSYPILHQKEYKVVVTIESKEIGLLEQATKTLLSFLLEESVYKVE
ncbi:MAG: competence/damage-inducible protein A [Nitrospirae bacterium]|nr:competence/damage-inducible protein A [Candidatus Troglogloeales bacterium]